MLAALLLLTGCPAARSTVTLPDKKEYVVTSTVKDAKITYEADGVKITADFTGGEGPLDKALGYLLGVKAAGE
jgi:hypothetical protein